MMMSASNKKIIHNSLSTGAVANALTYGLLGENVQVNYFGMSLPAGVATGVGCAAGSVVSDLTSDYVMKQLKINNQLMNSSTMAVKVGFGAAASTGALYLGGLPKEKYC